ncbi:indole-3-acetaldehyde oxidase [Neltuma alba]|uniref:indole-3-acetaldehyde oxidase n=1 Tax=Neltuma alba TaxID=207710 RepID=UPI0010A329D8|nr:indole-3-acetaldehyde oxidase-like [Prosopis alba]XP_028806120.1 indole-3-acetaldehyde oxidase-like [Prosopis alba]
MKENGETTATLVFAVNGERFELSSVDPSTTVLEFLRAQTPFKSVKLGCGEGGCGACLVLISKYNHVLDQVEDFTASSCLTLLCSIHGCSITTSEGLGNSKDGFHPIQERIAGFHATQCGFCTPGMCVSLFGTLVNAEKTNRPKPPPGFSKATAAEAERAICGNLCRCTGYRPLSDACKSFGADVDLEDLGLNSFWRKGESDDVKRSRLPKYDDQHKKTKFLEFLKEINPDVFTASGKHSWLSPTSLKELQGLLETNNNAGTKIKIVVSNTGMGYYKDVESYDKYINLKGISELSEIKKDETGIEIGTTVTIFKVIEALKPKSGCEFLSDFDMILEKIANHMSKVASGFIRNTASIGGNLVMAQKYHFPSDIATILLAVDTMVHIMNGTNFEWLTMQEFLERPPLCLESVLLRIKIPSWESNKSDPENRKRKILFETFRAAPRPLGNALAYINGALLVEVSQGKDTKGTLIDNCRLSFGAYGTKHAIRATKVEELLVGKLLSVGVMHEAINMLPAIIVPEEGTSRIAYRLSLAAGFLFKFLSPLIDHCDQNLNNYSNTSTSSSFFRALGIEENIGQVHHDKGSTFLSSGKQDIQVDDEYQPIGEPIKKAGAVIQASGEAVYVDDIPSPTNTLHGAYIYSTKPLARVKSIKLQKLDGVRAIISSKDIPDGGENVGSVSTFGVDPLFADEIARCIGDHIAFVVADTQKLADVAANSAIVEYDCENLEKPILSVEEAVQRSSLFQVPPTYQPQEVGDITKGMAEADHKILFVEIKIVSQYFFYMETQAALAVPDEDNSLTVYTSNQGPESAHTTIARCLNIPENNVRAITRRAGGGFGGKFTKANPVATSCALAAHKLRCPVRTYMNRKTDMITAGGRHPMKITYNVGFKSNGKITALELEILIDAGIYEDVSIVMPNYVIGALKKYDWGVLSFDVKLCKTNLPSRTSMRAPGNLQGSYIAEAIIEHVASTLSIDVDSVRSINLHTYQSLCTFYPSSAGQPTEYTLVSIWDKLAISARYDQRREMVEDFNRNNIWKKRGISRVPVVFEVTMSQSPARTSILKDGSVVVEVGGIEIGQGLWTKAKQMAAYALSLIQCDGSQDLLDKVRVIQSDTLSMIQGGTTYGSTTSESSCEAVRLSCNVLVERLKPFKEKLQKDMGSVDWNTLISQAHLQSVNLSATSFYNPNSATSTYLNYGVAVGEVEVDLLTGETTIMQTDIIYDCGKSLNPAVDLGQIEGAFVQGLGFFMFEEYEINHEGLVLVDGTWNYKIPTLDTITKQFNVEILNSGHHKYRVLSSKASGEPPLLLAAVVHCATRAAIKEARRQLASWSNSDELDKPFQLDAPATMPVVKELCGLDIVERYLKWKMGKI